MVVYFTSRTLLVYVQLLFTFLHNVTPLPLATSFPISTFPHDAPPSPLSLPSNLTSSRRVSCIPHLIYRLPRLTIFASLSARRWPRIPFRFPISEVNPDWIEFQRLGSTPPTDYHTRLLTDIIISQITIYNAQPAQSNPHSFSVTQSDVRFSMGSKAGQQMTMEVAREALGTLKVMVRRWGAIRLGFVVGSRGVEVGEGKVEFITDEE